MRTGRMGLQPQLAHAVLPKQASNPDMPPYHLNRPMPREDPQTTQLSSVARLLLRPVACRGRGVSSRVSVFRTRADVCGAVFHQQGVRCRALRAVPSGTLIIPINGDEVGAPALAEGRFHSGEVGSEDLPGGGSDSEGGNGEAMPDLRVDTHGTVVLLTPLTAKARRWIDDNVEIEPWQLFGDVIAIEPRYVSGLIAGAIQDGLEIEQ